MHHKGQLWLVHVHPPIVLVSSCSLRSLVLLHLPRWIITSVSSTFISTFTSYLSWPPLAQLWDRVWFPSCFPWVFCPVLCNNPLQSWIKHSFIHSFFHSGHTLIPGTLVSKMEYDLAFRKEAATIGLRDWPKINSDLHNIHLKWFLAGWLCFEVT